MATALTILLWIVGIAVGLFALYYILAFLFFLVVGIVTAVEVSRESKAPKERLRIR